MHDEFNFLRNFFQNNGFPSNIIDFTLNKFLNKLFSPRPLSYNVPRKTKFFKLPYFGSPSDKLKTDLLSLLSDAFPQIQFKPILNNDFKISNFFNYKDRLPSMLASSVIYEFCCSQFGVSVSYVGSTKRRLFDRVREHAGVSIRTGKSLSSPSFSNIRQHALSCKCSISIGNFKILASSNPSDLHILESIYIKEMSPNLNNQSSSFPLMIA